MAAILPILFDFDEMRYESKCCSKSTASGSFVAHTSPTRKTRATAGSVANQRSPIPKSSEPLDIAAKAVVFGAYFSTATFVVANILQRVPAEERPGVTYTALAFTYLLWKVIYSSMSH